MKLFDEIHSSLDFPFRHDGNSNYVWLIDNGHGSFTPGKRYKDFREYEFNRDVARRVCRSLLGKDVSYFLVVPEDDTDDFLAGRVARANGVKCKTVFVSIHSNAGPISPTYAEGIETFIYHRHSWQSRYVADVMQQGLVSDLGWRDRGVKTDKPSLGFPLYVLRKTRMPAVLLEVGFYNNDREVALLMQDKVRQKIADSIVKSILTIENKSRW